MLRAELTERASRCADVVNLVIGGASCAIGMTRVIPACLLIGKFTPELKEWQGEKL
jgi:hypothetical protein